MSTPLWVWELASDFWSSVGKLEPFPRQLRSAATRALPVRILSFAGPELARELLRPLACGGRFATVGLSQLTTSRQHQQPVQGRGLVLQADSRLRGIGGTRMLQQRTYRRTRRHPTHLPVRNTRRSAGKHPLRSAWQ